MANLNVKASPKTKIPIQTAVIGSNAPMTAVGVLPTLCTAMTMRMSDTTVGKTARPRAYTHIIGEFNGMSWAFGPKSEYT